MFSKRRVNPTHIALHSSRHYYCVPTIYVLPSCSEYLNSAQTTENNQASSDIDIYFLLYLSDNRFSETLG